MNGWMNKWTEWMDKSMNRWTVTNELNEWINERMSERWKEGKNRLITKINYKQTKLLGIPQGMFSMNIVLLINTYACHTSSFSKKSNIFHSVFISLHDQEHVFSMSILLTFELRCLELFTHSLTAYTFNCSYPSDCILILLGMSQFNKIKQYSFCLNSVISFHVKVQLVI